MLITRRNGSLDPVGIHHHGAHRRSTKANALGMRPMQERAYAKRGEQYLLIKSPPASGKSRALMFIALDKLHNQGSSRPSSWCRSAPSAAASPTNRLSQYGFYWRLDGEAAMEPVQRARASTSRASPSPR